MGRPVAWPDATTEISTRLQKILPREGKVKLGKIFFDGLSEKGVESILSGKTEPPPSALLRISRKLNVDLDWLTWGRSPEKLKSPATETGDEQIKKLFSILVEVHRALGILAESVVNGKVDAADAHQSVAEALGIVSQAHGKKEKAGKRQYNKTNTHDTGIA